MSKIWVPTPSGRKLVVFSKHIPFRGYFAINILGTVVVRQEFRSWFDDDATEYRKNFVVQCLQHETIHTKQMLELFIVGFYILYFLAWLVRIVTPPYNSAYRDISFEQEAFDHQSDPDYLRNRKPYAWVKYIFKTH